MDYVFHSGDPIANDSVRLSAQLLQQLLELAGYTFRAKGDQFDANQFLLRMTGSQFQFEVGSESWNKAEELLMVAQNTSGNVYYEVA
jgi:hypothetical protein